MKAIIKVLGVTFLILCLLAYCEKPTDPGDSEPKENITDLINSAGSFEVPEEKNEILNIDSSTVEIDGAEWICTTKTYSVVNCPDDYPNFNPNAEILFPGNLLQGKTLSQATPEPIVVKRGPGKVVLATLNASPVNLSEEVSEVTLGNMNDAMNKILARLENATPANFTYSRQEVQSKEQLAFEMNASFENLSFDAKTRLAFSTDKEYNRYLIKLNQSYFTYVYELPNSLEEVFAPEVTAKDLERYIQEGNPPAYISSITYGRIFYFLLESTSSKSEIEAALQASFDAAFSSGNFDANFNYLNELNEKEIKVFALGGDPKTALSATSGNPSDLQNFIEKGGGISTGVPLSYNIRCLASNQTVYNKVATEYDVKECVPQHPLSDYQLFWYRADELVELKDDSVVQKWGNSFESGIGDATGVAYREKNGDYHTDGEQIYPGPVLRMNQINGMPTVETRFISDNTWTWLSCFEYDGDKFCNRDYTIIAVVKLEKGDGGYFMFNLPWTYDRLTLGFNDPNQFEVKHDDLVYKNVDCDHFGRFKIYTVIFSQENGLTMRIDGWHIKDFSDFTQAVATNTKARIGVAPNHWNVVIDDESIMQIAEIKAYATAISEDDYKEEEKLLKAKYGL